MRLGSGRRSRRGDAGAMDRRPAIRGRMIKGRRRLKRMENRRPMASWHARGGMEKGRTSISDYQELSPRSQETGRMVSSRGVPQAAVSSGGSNKTAVRRRVHASPLCVGTCGRRLMTEALCSLHRVRSAFGLVLIRSTTGIQPITSPHHRHPLSLVPRGARHHSTSESRRIRA